MSATLIATIAGLVTAFCWGTSDWLAARSTKKLNALQVNFAFQIASLLIVGLLFAAHGLHINSGAEWLKIGASSVLINLAFLIFIQALSSGAVGIVVPLGNIYPLFTIILSVMLLNANFSFHQVAAMVIIILGAALLAYEKNHQKIPLRQLHHKTILALLAAVIWGVAFFIVSPVLNEVSWQSVAIASELFSVLSVGGVLALSSRRNIVESISVSLKSRPALIGGIFGELGLVTLYLGSSRAGSVVIPAVLSAGGPLVASAWGAVINHERIGPIKRVGALITVAGIIILNLT